MSEEEDKLIEEGKKQLEAKKAEEAAKIEAAKKENPDGIKDANDSELGKDVDIIQTAAYEKRKTELTEIEKRVDGKISELRSIVDEAKAQGKGLMVPKKTVEDVQKEKTNAMMNPLGYSLK